MYEGKVNNYDWNTFTHILIEVLLVFQMIRLVGIFKDSSIFVHHRLTKLWHVLDK